MKKLNVAKSVGEFLIAESSGRDLFGSLLELYLEGDQDDDVELNFRSVTTLGHDCIAEFVKCAVESSALPIHKIRQQVVFSGLMMNDMEAISKAFSTAASSINPDEVMKAFDMGLSGIAAKQQHNAVFEKLSGVLEQLNSALKRQQ